MYKRLSQNDLKKMRHEYLKKNGKCQILDIELNENTIVVDHAHRKRKSDEINEENGGLIRGFIHRQLNAFIGKIENNYRRYGLHNFMPLPELLRKIADYIENPPLYSQKLIHPSEKLPEKKLGKREFKKFKEYLIQKYPRRKSLQNLEYFSKIPKKYKDDFNNYLKSHEKNYNIFK